MAKKTIETKVSEVPKSNIELLLEKLLEGQEAIKNALIKPITSQAVSLNEPMARELSAKPTEPAPDLIPVPGDFRQTVDSILNKDFGVEIEPHRDAPLLTFTLVVPDKYSQMTPSQREILKRDIRPKVITTAGGVNEVKEWAETVYKNLTPEIQAMVHSDRMRV